MASLFDLLVKSGYEVQTIGDGNMPCTLMRQGEPVAVLMPDFSLRMLAGQESMRAGLDEVVQFVLENQEQPQVNGQFQLSSYRNYLLTADYQVDAQHAVYNVFRRESDGTLKEVSSAPDQATAAQRFAELSGLVDGRPFQQRRQAAAQRVETFCQQIGEKGYTVRRQAEKEPHLYEVYSPAGEPVGYIDKRSRFTITSTERGVRRELTRAYSTNNKRAPITLDAMPVGRVRQMAQNVGLALRVLFSRDGVSYSVRDRHHEVAEVNPRHEVVYATQNTSEQREAMEHMQDQFRADIAAARQPPLSQAQDIERREDKQEQEALRHQQEELQEEEQNRQAQAAVAERQRPQQEAEERAVTLTLAEAITMAQVINSIDGLKERIGVDLANKLELEAGQAGEQIALMVDKPEEQMDTYAAVKAGVVPYEEAMAQAPAPAQAEPTAQPQSAQQRTSASLSPQEQRLGDRFHQAFDLLQQLEGFGSPEAENMRKSMVAQYGTADPKVFEAKLQRGDYAKPTLDQKLSGAAARADAKSQAAERPQQQKER